MIEAAASPLPWSVYILPFAGWTRTVSNGRKLCRVRSMPRRRANSRAQVPPRPFEGRRTTSRMIETDPENVDRCGSAGRQARDTWLSNVRENGRWVQTPPQSSRIQGDFSDAIASKHATWRYW